ncbi:hypothetical protein V8G54_032758 [Vigna mungo]|uniref:Prefoldin subunit 3 n=1 Tax=Vigna mungo TaxID=3915 RepID=A0AAQ3RJ40_VIGMU
MASSSSTSGSGSGSVLTERRGIPGAQFVEDVQTYLTQSSLDVGSALAFLQERLQQYKVVEMKLLAQQRDLQAKIPDIEKCLDVVATLQAKKGTGELGCSFLLSMKSCRSVHSDEILECSFGYHFPSSPSHLPATQISVSVVAMESLVIVALITDFEVSEGIYSRARIEETDSVCLWLGANVMLEYSLEEATGLLQKNLDNARASLEVLIADLQFLRDQVTITQVTIARVYNWDVHQRRIQQAAAPTAQE